MSNKKFEHEIVLLGTDQDHKAEINKLGLQGWELVCAHPAGFKTIFYFKRELKNVPKKKGEETASYSLTENK